MPPQQSQSQCPPFLLCCWQRFQGTSLAVWLGWVAQTSGWAHSPCLFPMPLSWWLQHLDPVGYRSVWGHHLWEIALRCHVAVRQGSVPLRESVTQTRPHGPWSYLSATLWWILSALSITALPSYLVTCMRHDNMIAGDIGMVVVFATPRLFLDSQSPSKPIREQASSNMLLLVPSRVVQATLRIALPEIYGFDSNNGGKKWDFLA